MSTQIPEETLKQWCEDLRELNTHTPKKGLFTKRIDFLFSRIRDYIEQQDSEIQKLQQDRDYWKHMADLHGHQANEAYKEYDKLQERIKELGKDLEIKERVHQEKLIDVDETFNHYRTKTKSEIVKRDVLIEQARQILRVGYPFWVNHDQWLKQIDELKEGK